MRRKGFEPPTYWFVASYSIQLSYRRILRFEPSTLILYHIPEKMSSLFSKNFFLLNSVRQAATILHNDVKN